MADLELLLEAERRGILPDEQKGLLTEARNRGLIPNTEPQEGMPTRAFNATKEYLRKTATNAPGNALEELSNFGHALLNPGQTYENLSNAGASVYNKAVTGALQYGIDKGVITDPKAQNLVNAVNAAPAKPSGTNDYSFVGPQIANAMGQNISEAVQHPLDTFQNKPVSTLMVVAPALRGAGALADTAGLARTADVLGTVGTYSDPMTLVGKVGSAVPNALAATYGYGRDLLNPKNMAYLSSLEGRGQDVVNALRNTQAATPGVQLTSGQAASDVSGTLYPALEQDILGRRPNITAAVERQAQNEAARRAAVGEVAQTPEALQTAKETRTAETQPLYEQAKADTRMAAGRRDLNGVLQDIIKSNKANPPLVSMMEDIQNNVSTNVKQVRDVSSALDHVEGLLNSTNDPFVKSQLLKVKDKMLTMIPGMKAADEAFAAASKPVNTMQVGQELAGKLTPFEGSAEQGPAFQRAMANPAETFESATGRKMIGNLSDAIGPEATAKLEAVRQDIARQAKTEQLAAQGAKGGDSLEKASKIPHINMMDRIFSIASKILETTKGRITEATAKEMAAEFLKPELGANAIEKAMQYERARNAAKASIVTGTNQLGAVMRPSLYASNVLSPILNRNALAGQ